MAPKKPDTDTPGTGASDWMASMHRMQQSSLDPLRWFGTAWLESATEVNRELAEFLCKRISDDVRTQHEMLNCTDPAKLQEIQARFIQRAIDDYAAESGAVSDLGQAFIDRLSRRGGN